MMVVCTSSNAYWRQAYGLPALWHFKLIGKIRSRISWIIMFLLLLIMERVCVHAYVCVCVSASVCTCVFGLHDGLSEIKRRMPDDRWIHVEAAFFPSVLQYLLCMLACNHATTCISLHSVFPEGRPEISDVSPPVWNLWAVNLIPLFYIYISSLVLLPCPVAISVLSVSALGPFSWSVFPKPPFSER